MGKTILITGGARSGKSRLAEGQTLALGRPATYIATAGIFDAEMADRIRQHQDGRGPDWALVEEQIDLARALRDTDGSGPRLVDCLTLWLSNLMLGDHDIPAATQAFLAELAHQRDPVVIVTNEVGAGIVPENALARAFRDEAGRLNQRVAAVVDEVHMAVCGLPLKVKPHD